MWTSAPSTASSLPARAISTPAQPNFGGPASSCAQNGLCGFERDAEALAQASAARGGEAHGTAGRAGLEPAQLDQAAGERRGERPGQVVAPLRPVQAEAQQRAAAGLEQGQIEAALR